MQYSSIPLKPFQPSFERLSTPEAVEAGRKFLIDEDSRHNRGWTNFAIIDRNGKYRKGYGSCHGSTPDLVRGDSVLAATDNGCRRRKKESVELREPFLKWLLNDSPFSLLIENRDDYEFCRDYGFLININAPKQLVHGLFIVTRHFRECSDLCFRTWNNLVFDKGLHPLVCFTYCFSSNISANENSTKITYVRGYAEHRLGLPMGVDSLYNCFQGNLVVDSSETYKEQASIYGSSKLWRSIVQDPYVITTAKEPVLKKAVEEFNKTKQKKETYRPPNPFTRNKTLIQEIPGSLSFEEYVEVLIPLRQQQLQERFTNVEK